MMNIDHPPTWKLSISPGLNAIPCETSLMGETSEKVLFSSLAGGVGQDHVHYATDDVMLS